MVPVDAEQAMRDLAWTLTSASFIDGPEALGVVDFDPSTVDPAHLVASLGEAPRRVGHYFERLVRYWIEHVRGVELIAAGHQISRDGRTIGELDFVYRDEQGLVTHLEVAVKFYLYQPGRAGSHFPGPNVRDDFESKISRLFDHQLVIEDPVLEAVDRREACVRGMSFAHPTVPTPEDLPHRMAADHGRGLWLRASELDELDRLGFDSGCVREKPHWLGPTIAPSKSIRELRAQLGERFEADRRPTMVDLYEPQTTAPMRLCVVDDRWDHPEPPNGSPDRHRSS